MIEAFRTPPVKKSRRFFTLLLWALGIRRLEADSEYGEALARYRSWSTWPVSIMSIAVFILIAVKISLMVTGFIYAFTALNPEDVVMQYSLDTPVQEIILRSMTSIALEVAHSVPLWHTIPLVIMWLLAFVLDFIVSATLAENKGKWWKTHWGGIITALITIP